MAETASGRAVLCKSINQALESIAAKQRNVVIGIGPALQDSGTPLQEHALGEGATTVPLLLRTLRGNHLNGFWVST
jgi:hypothetical protein